MNADTRLSAVLVLMTLGALSACARDPQPAVDQVVSVAAASEEAPAPTPSVVPTRDEATDLAASQLPLLVVHKNASCGCCGSWVEHMRKAGFQVEVRNVDNLDPVKTRVGIPVGMGSCHTAEVGGYFVEGHVPAEDIKRMLADKPKARGLVSPGMPMGSPGMEIPSGEVEPYVVSLVATDGTTSDYARHGH